MKQFFQLTDASRVTVADLFCRAFGIDPNAPAPADSAIPRLMLEGESKEAFVTRKAGEYVVGIALEQRAREAASAASVLASSDADLE